MWKRLYNAQNLVDAFQFDAIWLFGGEKKYQWWEFKIYQVLDGLVIY